MEETWVRSLGWEDPLEEEMAIYSSILFFFFTPVFLPGESNGQRSLSAYSPWGCRVRHDLATKQQQQRYEKTFVFKNDFILDNVGALERTQPNIQR